MSKATVYSTAQFGLADSSSATGLYAASVTFTANSDTAEALDHIGGVVGLSVFNARKDVSVDGVVKTKGSGLATEVGSVVTIAEATNNSRAKLSEDLGVTAVAGAAVVVTGGGLTPKQNGFEEGSVSGVYHPYLDTGSPTTLS